MNDLTTIKDSINKLDAWISKNNWKDYDPFDGLNARYLIPLTFNNHYLRIIVQQSVRRFFINLRPILGIKKETSSKGMGFCALGYLNLYKSTHNDKYIEKAKYCLDWLINNSSAGYSGYCWGNHFSYESRGGCIPLGVPTIVWTSLIANVFFDAYKTLNEPAYLKIAQNSCDHILNDIATYKDSPEAICFMYTPQSNVDHNGGNHKGCIHNSNVLGAWLLANFYRHTRNKKIFSIAKKSVNYTLKYQRPNGGWYYGEEQKFRWIDNFHTGYVLEAIHGYIKATNDTSPEEMLKKGFEFFKSTFFKPDGTPRYYDHKTYPIDIQCASQGIQTLVNLKEYDKTAMELATKVALWTIKNMQHAKGYFYFRKYPLWINKTPMFHWGQATMLAALTVLLKETATPYTK
jgi:hypothetical protein